MKKIMTLVLLLAMAMVAHALPFRKARKEALYLSDKMAYTLSLTSEQYEAVYEINLDYFLCIGGPDDILGSCWDKRNEDLRDVLSDWQWEQYIALEYFYRPVRWEDDAWVFLVYDHFVRGLYYFERPIAYANYKGAADHAAHAYRDAVPDKPSSPAHHSAPMRRDAERIQLQQIQQQQQQQQQRPNDNPLGTPPPGRPGGFGGPMGGGPRGGGPGPR